MNQLEHFLESSQSSEEGAQGVPYLDQARRLFAQVKPILLQYPNVHGVSVGLRHIDGKPTGEAAFVVSVIAKRTPSKSLDALPRELMGVPIDVQEAPMARLAMDIAGGGDVRRVRGPGSGRIGLVTRDGAGGEYALSAMHVFADTVPTHLALGGSPTFEIEGRMFVGNYESIGQLVAGDFNRSADIACIRIWPAHAVVGSVLGTTLTFDAPAEPSAIPLGGAVDLAVPGQGTLSGTLVGYPYDGTFGISSGDQGFSHLMKIKLQVSHIQGGWSGSTLFRPVSKRPLALLSFGSIAANADGSCYAYGFPLCAFYHAWGLRPV